MTASHVRIALTLLLVLVLAGAIAATVCWYDWLDRRGLAGLVIVGLSFSAIAILGIDLQLGQDFGAEAPPSQVVRQFLIYAAQMLVFIPSFLGGIWLLLKAVHWLLPASFARAAVGLVFTVAFLCYIAGVIKLLTWLSNRGLIGGRF